MAINGVVAIKQCATGIEIDTSVHDVPSSKACELTAINLKNNLKERGLEVTFDEHRRMAKEEAVNQGGVGSGGEASVLEPSMELENPQRVAIFVDESCVTGEDSSVSLTTTKGDGAAGVGGGADWKKKRHERMVQMQQQIDAVFPDHSLRATSTASHSEEAATSTASHAEEAAKRTLLLRDGVEMRRLPSLLEIGLPGTPAMSWSENAALEIESMTDVPRSLQQQEPLVAKAFIVMLPYTVDEFDADLHFKYKHAVSVTAGVSVDNVTINTVKTTMHRASGIEVDTSVTGLSSSRARDLTAKNLNRNLKAGGLQWYRSASLESA